MDKVVTQADGRISRAAVECAFCGLYGICKLAGLEQPEEQTLLDYMVSRREPIPQGGCLFNAGDPFQELFAVKSGSFKTYAVLESGREQVIGFHFPGELIGVEAIAAGRYPYTVKALESASVCRLELQRMALSGEQQASFQEQLIAAMSRRAQQEQWVPLLMGAQTAEQRIALFLLSVACRFAVRDLPSGEFRLPMSRSDIANYLGLAVETISRMLQRFQNQRLLVVHGRNLRLRNLSGIRSLAGIGPLTTTPMPLAGVE